MSGRAKAETPRLFLGRLALCAAAAILFCGATWLNPGSNPGPAQPAAKPTGSMASEATLPGAAAARMPSAAGPGLVVTGWGLGSNPSPASYSPGPVEVASGRPFYIRLTIEGDAAAIDMMRTQGGIPILVHWTPETGGAKPSAPALSTRLTVGGGGLAAALAGEVEHTGHFVWHTWTRKDTLSPGQWSVSLTYSDGRPLACGSDLHPCRFSFEIG